MTNIKSTLAKGKVKIKKKTDGQEQIGEHMLWEGLGSLIHQKNIEVSFFCVLEIRVWVKALKGKLSQEKLFELMLHLLSAEMLQLINP